MLYELYELRHMLAAPVRFPAEMTRAFFQSPLNPLSLTPMGRAIGASAEIISRLSQRFTRPAFGLHHTRIGGKRVSVKKRLIADRPFCQLLNFERSTKRNDPKVLLVAPLSGHFATLLRGTIEALLPHHDVYITDWKDAREVPLSEGHFNMDDSMAYIHDFMGLLGPETHVIAVCQPSSLVMGAIAIMASERDPNQPASMILMGGPVDTRVSKTEVSEHAQSHPLRWFENNVIHTVPPYYPGAGRRVYPGFLQLSGFMSMNFDAHVDSHFKFFQHLVEGDGESSDKHRAFYNEYLSVMDLTAEFYLQTISEVFQKQSLPRGRMKWRNPRTGELLDVRPQDIRHTALMTIEGELDDITARGNTVAAHELCLSLPQRKQYHHLQMGCGHYGIFNGSRWRNEVMPRIRHFIRQFDEERDPIPQSDLKRIPDIAAERFDHDIHGVVAVRRWLKEYQPGNYKRFRGIQERTEDTDRPEFGFYLTPEEYPAPKPKPKPKKKKPRIKKGHNPKVSVQLPLLEPLEKVEKPDPRANVIEVNFSSKNKKESPKPKSKPKPASKKTKAKAKPKRKLKAKAAKPKNKTKPSSDKKRKA